MVIAFPMRLIVGVVGPGMGLQTYQKRLEDRSFFISGET